MTTCADCRYRVVMTKPFSRELGHFCANYPPKAFCVPSPAGISVLALYPEIAIEWPACGEHTLKEADALNVVKPLN